MEACGVESVAQVRNQHVELQKREYSHLRGPWFSDVCKGSEIFDIDVLIGSDFLWCFQNGNTVRGKANEPVAVETTLGWVLSGKVKGPSDGTDQAQVSGVYFVKEEHVSNSSHMSDNVHRLWDLDTVGIREEDEVHEALKEAISFNGTRYQVHLPWKEGHEPLPSNYTNSLKRLKTQICKMKRDPDILEEYSQVINSQLEAGIIESAVVLEKAEKVHYLTPLFDTAVDTITI